MSSSPPHPGPPSRPHRHPRSPLSSSSSSPVHLPSVDPFHPSFVHPSQSFSTCPRDLLFSRPSIPFDLPPIGPSAPQIHPHHPLHIRPRLAPLQSPAIPPASHLPPPPPPAPPAHHHPHLHAQLDYFPPPPVPFVEASPLPPSDQQDSCSSSTVIPDPSPPPLALEPDPRSRDPTPASPSTALGDSLQPSPEPIDPVLKAFFSASSQLIFAIPAYPLFRALCRRRRIAKSQDPDELALLPIYDHSPVDLASSAHPTPAILSPSITTQDADVGANYNLPELLSAIYSNPAAERFAFQALIGRSNQPDFAKERYWDIMKLFRHNDLSRWLNWLRDIFDQTHDPPPFRATLNSPKSRSTPQPSSYLNKLNHPSSLSDHSHPFETSVGAAPVVSEPPEIVMTATIVDPGPRSRHLKDPVSSQTITINHVIVFSAIVLRPPSNSNHLSKASSKPLGAPSQASNRYCHSALSSTSEEPTPGPDVYRNPSSNPSKLSSTEVIRPKRIRTSLADSFSYPSSKCLEQNDPFLVSSHQRPIRRASLADQRSTTTQITPKAAWLDEQHAKRMLLKAGRRTSRSNASRWFSAIPTPSHTVPKSFYSRRESHPNHSALSSQTLSTEQDQTLSKLGQTSSDLDSMMIDDPWFRGLSVPDSRAGSLHSSPYNTGPTHHSQPITEINAHDKRSLDDVMVTQDESSFADQGPPFLQQISLAVSPFPNETLDDGYPVPDSGALQNSSKSAASPHRESRPRSPSLSSSASAHDLRNVDHDPFQQSLMNYVTGRLILDLNWEDTPIGPMERWSPTLRSMVALIMASPYRMSLLWGDECVMLYNDAYIKCCGRKHPSLLGQSGSHGWAELWADLGETADSVLKGDVYTVYDSLLFFDRDPDNPNGISKEETYHSFSWIPVRGPTGKVEGILNPSFETTLRVIAERRLGSLRDLVQISLVSRNSASYKERCLESFTKNPLDLPFVIMYACEAKISSHRSSGTRIPLLLKLAGAIGVPKGHPSATEEIEIDIPVPGSDLQPSANQNNTPNFSSPPATSRSSVESIDTTLEGLTDHRSGVWPLQEACTFRKPIYIAKLGDRAHGFELRGWADPPRSAVVMSVSTSEDSLPLGVIVFGLSPRLYWTEAYAIFLNLLARQFATGLSTVISHEEKAQRLEELASLDRAKTAFFTNISHELRTPLTLIVGPISEILDSRCDISPAARERLKIVERNTQRLINLVNQLLDLSRFEAGKMVARFKSTDLSKFTSHLAALFRSAMLKKQIDLIVDCPNHHQRVWIDQDFFEKVIFNLLSNSMKFTPRGGQVVVRVRFDSDKCYLTCSDTGIGIKPEDIPKIFERFHRVQLSTDFEGTGIGLSLVQDIIKLHHGQLSVESEVARGSKFIISLQLGTAHLPTDCLDHSTETELEKMNDRVVASNARRWILGEVEPIRSLLINESPSSSEASSSRGSADTSLALMGEGVLSTTGSTVLIADDNADMRGFLKSVLSRHFTVLEASDAQQAYQWAKFNQPDILVSDVMMPGMDGFQLLKRLKADSDTAMMSVILLSARAGPESRIEGLAEGADDYLVKPFEAKELVARVNTHLQIAKMRQRLECAVTTRTRLLRENEQKYRDLYHTFEVISMLSPVGIIQLSPSGKVTFANNSFRSQCKLSASEPLTAWMDSIHLSDKKTIELSFEKSIRARQPIKGEFRWKDESWCFYEFTPYYLEDDRFEGYLGSTTDVTERKESERKQLEAAEARARDAEESKRQQEAFIDMTSHEIRNPLHGIHQAAELLHSSLKTLCELVENNYELSGADIIRFRSELREDIDAVESIQLCASHQSRIADDIINVSKLSMGLLTTIKTDFDLVGRVREVLSMYLIEAQQKSVDLKLQIGEGLETTHYISADPNRLAQVVINFLSNALRYTSTSEGPRSVTVRVDLHRKCPEQRPYVRRIGSLKLEAEDEILEDLVYARVSVQDTARGLSPDELSKLFSRFVQANPTQDQYGGSGLGLYVSHRLIENHGGFIEVMSTKGQGSVFSFVIPTKRTSQPLSSDTASYEHGGKRGFARAVTEEEVVEMQPAFALMPVGTVATGGGITSRLPSPDIRSSPTPSRVASTEPNLLRVTEEQLMKPAEASSVPSLPLPNNGPSPRPIHVLVVEDNLINVKVIKRQLTLKGYQVSVAMDGRQALNKLYSDASDTSGDPPIDIVLMDIQMPVMNGLEAITHLRAAEKTGDIKKRYPVIAVTGNARKEQTEQCIASGFDSICVKPYKIDDVQSRMEALLANFRLDDI